MKSIQTLLSALVGLKATDSQISLANNLTEFAPFFASMPFIPSNRGELHDYADTLEIESRQRRGFGQGYSNRSARNRTQTMNLDRFGFSIFVGEDEHRKIADQGNVETYIRQQLAMMAGDDGAATEKDFLIQLAAYAAQNHGQELGGRTLEQVNGTGPGEEIIVVTMTVGDTNPRGGVVGVFNGAMGGQARGQNGAVLFSLNRSGSINDLQEFPDSTDSDGRAYPGYKVYSNYQLGLLMNNPRSVYRFTGVDAGSPAVTPKQLTRALRFTEAGRSGTVSFIVGKPEILSEILDGEKIEKMRYQPAGNANVETEIETWNQARVINTFNTPDSSEI